VLGEHALGDGEGGVGSRNPAVGRAVNEDHFYLALSRYGWPAGGVRGSRVSSGRASPRSSPGGRPARSS
jgi:hypothetical protein